VSIYKACDIRGLAETELNPDLYYRWGRALGRQVDPQAKFVVGGDTRRSTPAFLDALATGLVESGVNVVELGILPTPMIYYARRRLQAEGAAIVTASHNPAPMNGLKWLLGDMPPTADDVAELGKQAETRPRRSRRQPGSRRALDVSYDYVAWLQETWFESMGAEFRIVLDPLFGCGAQRARRYLQAVFPRILFSAIHDEVDPDFGGRAPDCSRPERLHELAQAVEHAKADLGLAFDGDMDRVAFVDGDGVPLTAEEATCILVRSLGSDLGGEPVVYDQKFSNRLHEVARTGGAEPVVERSGHAFIRARMLESGACFGAEISGHYFYRALGGGDDGLFAACWMIDWLAHCGQKLATLRASCPPVFMTPDLRVPLPPKRHKAVLKQVRTAWSRQPQSTLDGIRIDFDDGWALVRSSVTEPALTFRFESGSWEGLEQRVRRFCDELDEELGDLLWVEYTTAMGHSGQGDQCSCGLSR